MHTGMPDRQRLVITPTVQNFRTESKALPALCRADKLYEVERWIALGKSIGRAPANRKPGIAMTVPE